VVEKTAPQLDAAKQAALAALQPIAPAPRPVAAPKAASATTKPPVTKVASTPVTRPPATAPVPVATSQKLDIGHTQPIEMLPEMALLPVESPAESNVSSAAEAKPEKIDLGSTQPLGTLAQELANAALSSSLDLPDDILPPSSPIATVAPSVAPMAVEKSPPPVDPASTNLTEFGELALMATGEWQAMQRSDVQPESKPDTAATGELNGPQTLSLISTPAPKAEVADPKDQLVLLPDPTLEPKRAANGQ
jgi:hypothetical protein